MKKNTFRERLETENDSSISNMAGLPIAGSPAFLILVETFQVTPAHVLTLLITSYGYE